MEPVNETIKARLDGLRRKMKEEGIAAVIVPQADPHLSEYLARHWQGRRWLSGFTGSAGDLVVTADGRALLWTDSRYFLQAGRQLEGTGIELMKDGLPGTPSISEWLSANLGKGDVAAFDGMVVSGGRKTDLEQALARSGVALRVDFDPLEGWTDRPELPECEVFVHSPELAGATAHDKIDLVLAAAEADTGARAVLVSALDEIAWLLNIRSRDVRYNPVATAFLYLSRGKEGNVLFINPKKITPRVAEYLRGEGVETRPYGDIKAFLAALPADERVHLNTGRTASAIIDILGGRVAAGESPAAMPKAVKNAVQIEGFRAAMVRDGVAMVKSLREIELAVADGKPIGELEVAEILVKHRSESDMFFDESFGTICGYGPHGAIVHYEADAESSSALKPEGVLLIDSGAQYLDGTTDITRTIALGSPTALEKKDFTLVLKGNIALARAVFPAGTCGTQLDVLARQFLWREGLTYLHGTGHGVGHFLNVHEGPHQIRMNNMPAKLRPGMLVTNEPGLYREGVHGIRCENMELCVPAMTTEFGEFYKFETLTLCPFDLRLMERSLLTNEEIAWLNNYHSRVRSALTPYLDGETAEWLRERTMPIMPHLN